MNSSTQILPAAGHRCGRYPRTQLGPIDRKKNGGWFATCSQCCKVDSERHRNKRRRPDTDTDKENTNLYVDSSATVPIPTAFTASRATPFAFIASSAYSPLMLLQGRSRSLSDANITFKGGKARKFQQRQRSLS